MVINIAICGGGSATQRHLKASLRGYLQVKDLYYEIDLYQNAKVFLEQDKESVYDLLFLSAVAKEDGAALDKSLRAENPWIRLVYVLQREETMEIVGILHANDHLRKPFAKMDFFGVLQRSVEYLHYEEKSKKIIFRNGVDFLCLRVEDIFYIEATTSHKIQIVTRGTARNIRYMIRKAFVEIQKYGFGQPHRAYVVNLMYVERITGSIVYLTNGAKITLTKRKAPVFRDAVTRYIQRESL